MTKLPAASRSANRFDYSESSFEVDCQLLTAAVLLCPPRRSASTLTPAPALGSSPAMSNDEQAIRALIAAWARATAAGDVNQLLKMMSEDVAFLTPGQPPMRRDAFAASFKAALQHVHISASSDIQEIKVAGDLAYCWNHLTVTVTPLKGGSHNRRSGFTLTILRKKPGGSWVIARDANLLTPEPPAAA